MAAVAPSLALTAALAYAARGWPVFPVHSMRDAKCSCGSEECTRKGKHPRTYRGRDEGTTDTGIIRSWWARWPDANVGIATGELPGGGHLVVLDVDPRHGGDEALGGLERQHGGMPETPRVITGGGGVHFYLVSQVPVQSTVQRVGEGLDVRGTGGYVLAPPSNHESGGTYREDAGAPLDIELAPVPAWLAVLAGRPEPRAPAQPVEGAIVEGGRNDVLASLAGTMRRRGFGTSAIFAALSAENRERCRPPLDDLEVRRIAAGIGSRYAPTDPPRTDDPWHVMTTAQIFAPLPPYPWLVPGLHLAPGRITLLNGYADVGKTVIAMTVAIAVASGSPVWGVYAPARAGRVLHMNGEIGSYIARERYQRIARGYGLDVQQLTASGALELANYPELKLDDKDFEDRLRAKCEGFSLVVIDSLRAFSGGLDENAKEIGVALLMLARVSEATGATIVVLHHNRKPSKDDVGGAKMSISGSSSILGGAECAFVMTAEKGGPILVQHERSPIGRPLEDFGLRIEDVEHDGDRRWGLRVVHMEAEQMDREAEAAKTERMRRDALRMADAIIVTLEKAGGGIRCSQKELRSLCGGGRDTVFSVALHDLRQAGRVLRQGTYHQAEWVLAGRSNHDR